MATSAEPQSEDSPNSSLPDRPDVSVCESRPGKVVFIEADNTDGWIASDSTVALRR